MKKCTLIGLAAAVAFGASFIAPAQSAAPAVKVATVNVQKVQHASVAMKGLREKVQALSSKYIKTYDLVEKQTQAEYDRLRKDKELSRNEYDRRVRALRADLVRTRRQKQARDDALSRAFNKAFEKFHAEFVLVVRALAVEQGLTLVLNQGTLIHSTPQYEITDKVVARLNKRLPKLELDYKDPVGNAAAEAGTGRAKAPKKK